LWYQRIMPQPSGIRRVGEACRVLVVEDNFDSAEVLCLMIQQAGHDCRVALDASEARTITEDFAPDVALIDIGLPGETGYELLRYLKHQPALVGCRFVALTGYAGPEMLKRSIEAGYEAHLTKPVGLELLLAVLDQCSSSPDPVIARPAS
jgi:two-component system, sensor histidine kinase